MSRQDKFPSGVPCWVEALVPNAPDVLPFYGELFGWEFVGSGKLPEGSTGEYFVARKDGRDVCGIAPAPPGVNAGWSTQIAVDLVEDSIRRVSAAGGKSLIAEPFDAAPAGRLGVFMDPIGAVFATWESADRQGAQLVNEPGVWANSVLHTNDVDRATQFYADAFDWKLESNVDVVHDESPAPYWAVVFWIDDVAGALQTVERLGGKVLRDLHDASSHKEAVVRDPQGAIFTIRELTL